MLNSIRLLSRMTKKPEHNHNREQNLGMFEKALKHLFLDSTTANHSKPDTLMPPQLHTMSGVNTSTRNQKHNKNIHFHKTEKDNAFLSLIPNLRNHRVMKCSQKQTKAPPNNMNVLISIYMSSSITTFHSRRRYSYS